MKDLKENHNNNGYHNTNLTLFLRFWAFVIDILILEAVSIGIFLQFYIEEKSLGNILYLLNSYILVLISLFFINAFLYHSLGGSIGKIIMGVVVRDQNKRFLKFRDYFFREFIAKNLSYMLFGIGFIYAFFNPKQQTFHDLASNTTVSHKLSIKNPILIIIFAIFAIYTSLVFNDKVLNSNLKETSLEHSKKVLQDLLYHLE